MSRVEMHGRLQVPESLQTQLHEFRRRVWTTKMVEAAGLAVAGATTAFLGVFALDRLGDTPMWVRAFVAIAAVAACAFVPYAFHRWVWRRRRLEQLARLLSHKLPRVGDSLLGVIELAHNDQEQARSRALCQAAIEQVAADASKRDLRAAAPETRSRFWALAAGGALAGAFALAAFFPAAASNAWLRFVAPWRDTPRYTFAAVEPMPEEIVVAHGEPFTLAASLHQDTMWRPEEARMQLGQQPELTAKLTGDGYEFAAPALIDDATATITVGDWSGTVRIVPKLRPELATLQADVQLPQYLGQDEPLERDVRGGGLTMVKGSRATFTAGANRPLASATVDGDAVKPADEKIITGEFAVEEPRDVQLEWQDKFGLAGREPFTISITAEEDAAPNVTCDDMPRRKVILDSEQIVFHVAARDDFGVQQVGMEWKGVDDDLVATPAKGEQLLAPGAHDKSMLEVQGTFTATSLGIEPQPIEVRIFVTDYYPGRERVYSPPYLLYVLDANTHAIWITEQMSKWHRQALEVRDREMRLYETNKQLRDLSPEDMDLPRNRRAIENQAAAERANGRRLANLSSGGAELLRQAARNPEIGVGHLDRWAEMLGILQDISANRMPSVADLLKEASQAVASSSATPAASGPMAGQVRAASGGGPGNEAPKDAKTPPSAPTLADMESSQQPQDGGEAGEPTKKNPTAPSLRLPVTTVMGQRKKSAGPAPAPQKVDEAVREQKDLLAEFERVANELNEVLANLEGSTLVKRLKAASRQQYKIAGRLGDFVEDAFGGESEQSGDREGDGFRATVKTLAQEEQTSSDAVSLIMDDMEAYFERRRLVRFKSILDEMRSEDVIGGLRRIADDIPVEHGVSIAQAEFWSDTMDRWAEDLVDPACSGQCPGCRSKGSLPPSIVLEVLKILEAEINLREETRVAEQARPAVEAKKHGEEADRLGGVQHSLDDRTLAVIDRILQLPDAEAEFGKELALLGQVSTVMREAVGILETPETGNPAIAAETEVIELLLKSKRINPNGGGGGGATPGGGGGGDTKDNALALLGAGLNQHEVREDRGIEQATGESGTMLPEEFRAGLDRYFNELETAPDGG
jgi:hypothetical protein